ncbi:MAG TPA: ubiquinone biosynthesis regulatory protein kinase UbiB, partial [Burkholderiaceae bacterium]|nr:ubiquinone biosynthesis regulatory protein kinase UbiB [Burkholderiaceae bacterium]
NRPLKDISFAQVLMRLFETSRRFNVEVQPQLVLLQKTLFNIEGLGRQLDPDLDLWATAMPFLERHMQRQMGLEGIEQRLRREVGQWAQWLPQWPRLLHQALIDAPARAAVQQAQLRQLLDESRKRNRWLMSLVGTLGVGVLMMLWVFLGWPLPKA